MNRACFTRRFAATWVVVTACIASSVATADPHHQVERPASPDEPPSLFYTTYVVFGTDIQWMTCGYDRQSSGCFGSGTLGPFGRVCAVAGSSKRVVVADAAAADGMTSLSIYEQVESTSPSATLLKQIVLDIPGSTTSICHMAIGGDFLYFGTNESEHYLQVNLRDYQLTNGICRGHTSSITASNNLVTVSVSGCFATYANNGVNQGFGGENGDEFVPGTNAYRP